MPRAKKTSKRIDADLITLKAYRGMYIYSARHGATAQERDRATGYCLKLYRAQRDEMLRSERVEIDAGLWAFVHEKIRDCSRQNDPLAAIESLLATERQKRGRPKKPHDEVTTAVRVSQLVRDGDTIESACAKAAKENVASKKWPYSASRIKRIYLLWRTTKAVRIGIF